MVPLSKAKPIRNVKIKLKIEVSVSEILQKNNMSLTTNERTRKIKTNVLSNENLLGNNLFHMVKRVLLKNKFFANVS